MPNGIADRGDSIVTTTRRQQHPLVQRTTPPVAGRWGEAASIPGVPFPTRPAALPSTWSRAVLQQSGPRRLLVRHHRPAHGLGYANTLFPRDAADDNYNMFDPFPSRHDRRGQRRDFYDAAGALLLPVERMRRFVTPVDINGTGRVPSGESTAEAGHASSDSSAADRTSAGSDFDRAISARPGSRGDQLLDRRRRRSTHDRAIAYRQLDTDRHAGRPRRQPTADSELRPRHHQ